MLVRGQWSPIHYSKPSEDPLKYLGALFTADLNWSHQTRRLHSIARTLLHTSRERNASLAEFRYILDMTIHSSLLYRTTIVPLSQDTILELDRRCVSGLKHHAHMPRASSSWMWLAPATEGGAEHDTLLRKTVTAQLTNFVLWLTNPLTPTTTHALYSRLAAHGRAHGLPTSPLFMPAGDRPTPLPKRTKLTMCEALYAHCFELGVQLCAVQPPTLPPRFPSSLSKASAPLPIRLAVADEELWVDLAPHLQAHDILYISDIATSNRTLVAYQTLHTQKTGSTRAATRLPEWYCKLRRQLTDDKPPFAIHDSLLEGAPFTSRHTLRYTETTPSYLPQPLPLNPPLKPLPDASLPTTVLYTDGSHLKSEPDGTWVTAFAAVPVEGLTIDPKRQSHFGSGTCRPCHVG